MITGYVSLPFVLRYDSSGSIIQHNFSIDYFNQLISSKKFIFAEIDIVSSGVTNRRAAILHSEATHDEDLVINTLSGLVASSDGIYIFGLYAIDNAVYLLGERLNQ